MQKSAPPTPLHIRQAPFFSQIFLCRGVPARAGRTPSPYDGCHVCERARAQRGRSTYPSPPRAQPQCTPQMANLRPIAAPVHTPRPMRPYRRRSSPRATTVSVEEPDTLIRHPVSSRVKLQMASHHLSPTAAPVHTPRPMRPYRRRSSHEQLPMSAAEPDALIRHPASACIKPHEAAMRAANGELSHPSKRRVQGQRRSERMKVYCAELQWRTSGQPPRPMRPYRRRCPREQPQ